MANSGQVYEDSQASPATDIEEHTHPFGAGSFAAKYVIEAIPAGYASEKRIDYDGRTDSNPVYVGFNEDGATTSDTDWLLQKISYDGSDRVVLVEVATGSWDGRASAF